MSIISLDLTFDLVIDTVTRQKRIRCTIVALPEMMDGWEWPAELPTYRGLGTTMEEAIQNALLDYRNARG